MTSRRGARRGFRTMGLRHSFIALCLTGILGSPVGPVEAQRQLIDHPMTVEYDVRVAMRDGVALSADVYRPAETGRHPAVLTLTPYNNNSDATLEEAWAYVSRGYAYMTVDVRGRYDSEGEFNAWYDDSEDGSDLIDWIAAQEWSDGRVATSGGSYSGMNQWLMAKQNNPHHVAILGYVAPRDSFRDLVRWNGVPKLDLIYTWMMGMDGRVNQSRIGWNWNHAMRGLPLHSLDEVVGRDMPVWRAWMENDTESPWWDPISMHDSYANFDIPSFNVTGWFDGQVQGTSKHFASAVKTGEPADHVLIIGPWLHGVNRNRTIGLRDYGPDAIIELDALRDAWLDHSLLGTPRPDLPNVLYFLPVANEWREADAWPIPGTRFTSYYLTSGGSANTLFGNGELVGRPPRSVGSDAFVYDPTDPVPTVSSRTSGARGGIAQGSVDNRAVETRDDVLVYTGPVLDEPVEITGPIRATIHISTDVRDTDITVKLLDVYPDGRALNLSHGIARASFRTGYDRMEPIEPGEVYAIEVEMFPGSNVFEAGHRMRIEVSSSNFPNFARNLNTGKSSDTTSEMRVAHTRVHHSAEHPSHIVLPLIPAGTTRPWR